MLRLFTVLLISVFALTACAPVPTPTGSDGKPLPRAYKIRAGAKNKIQFRMLDSVNTLRANRGLPAVQMEPRLTAAAATHSLDMSVQNRPWHFGSDGSSPVDRVQRVGYTGGLVGEVISETYETELETLGAWMSKPDTRRVIMDKTAVNMGFAWHQEEKGKIWWTLVMGR